MKALALPDDKRLIATVHCYYQLEENDGQFSWSNDKPNDTQPMLEDFAAIKQFMTETGIPVIIGEWGNQEGLPVADRIDQVTYFIKKAKEMGIPCFWWDAGWYDLESPNERIGLYDRTRMEWVWPEIMEATMKVVYGE